ncbi:MAG: hypothetical protein ABIT37_05905 [Luteolibacter sp.]
MKPRALYQRLCEATNLDAAVKALSPDELTKVAEYLAALKPSGGLPAQVWGVIQQALNPAAK